MNVQACFLGEPRLIIDNVVKMPGKNKLEALLFYLLYHEEIDRAKVASVFWPQKDEAHAKSSLRNSLYEIRQLLDVDLFEASGRDRIMLSRDIRLEKDVDLLLGRDQPSEGPELDSYVFLKGLELKDNEVYETWLFSMREAYRSILANELAAKLRLAADKGRTAQVMELTRRLLSLDPYHEPALREQLKSLADTGRYNEALASYLRFKKTLDEELGVEPEPETVRLAEFILSRKRQLDEHPREAFERSALFMKLAEVYRRFRDGQAGAHVLVYGEPGSGRTALIEAFLETRPEACVTLELDHSNKALAEGFLTKWALQFKGTGQADFRRVLFDLPETPLIVVLRNVENMDGASLPYLQDVLSARQNRLFFILEGSAEIIRVDSTFAINGANGDLVRLEVPLLSRAELNDYLSAYARKNGRVLSEGEVDEIFAYSQGNLLLANECLEPRGLGEGLFARLTVGLSKEEKKLLDAATVYPEGFTPAMAKIHTTRPEQLMDHLRSLVSRGLLKEADGLLAIKYPPLAQWLYDDLPDFYRAHLHELAAQNTPDLKLSERLDARYRARHWKSAGNQGKSLFYRLKEVELTLDFYDELYPALVEPDDIPDNFTQSRTNYNRLLAELTEEVTAYCEKEPSQEAGLLEVIAAFLNGRRLIAGGSREEGMALVRFAIRRAAELGNQEYLLKGRIEGIHYAIQKDDLKAMGTFIALTEELIAGGRPGPSQRKRAEVLRLEGLYHFNSGHYDEALKRLDQADEILQESRYRKTGFLARAGTLNYLGRTREAMGDRAGADEAYRASIALVEGKVHKCLDILYTDYGKFLWLGGREEEARFMLERALAEFNLLGTHWKRPAAEAISGLIALGRGDQKAARGHLINAQIYHKADRRGTEEALIGRLARDLAEEEHKETMGKRQRMKGDNSGVSI